MSMPIKRPEHTIRQAFEEIDRAGQFAAEQGQALAEAQQRADAAQALVQAAQVQLTNAEARYSVLARTRELAAPELAAVRARIAERERELGLIEEQLRVVEVQAETVRQGRTALGEVFRAARDAASEAVAALEAMNTSIQEMRGLPASARKARIDNMCDALEARYDEVRDRWAEHEPALADLDTAIETLRADIPSAGYRQELVARQEWLVRDLDEATSELAKKEPAIDQDELRRASDDLEAARFAAEEAPVAVTRAQADLLTATTLLAQAQARQQSAQANFDKVEAEFVTGIEVSEPNPQGFITARALVSQPIPSGYTLSWQAGAASVTPQAGDVAMVSIDTNQLPVGQTMIEARLVRVPATA